MKRRGTRRRRFTLGDWSVDPSLGVIERDGIRSALEPRLLDVLGFLAERKGDVATIDELLDACWSGGFHGDNPVHKAIAMLRKALGDDARAPRYVATIRKRGYRVVVPVRFGDADESPPAIRAAPPPAPALGDVEVVAALAERWYAGGRRPEDLLPQCRLLAHATALVDDREDAMSRDHARFVRRSHRQAVVRSSILVCMSSTILSLAACVLLAVLDGRRAAASISAGAGRAPAHAPPGCDDGLTHREGPRGTVYRDAGRVPCTRAYVDADYRSSPAPVRRAQGSR